MKNTRGVSTGAVAAAISATLFFSPTAQSASLIDIPQPGGNTIQANAGGDVFQPGFSLWPLPSNNANIHTESNIADGRGNAMPGQFWLLGFGAGNTVQFATGGNIIAPQVALGRDNNLTTVTDGNTAVDNGNDGVPSSGTGLLIDGNGNVFQVAFLQGNIIAPQFSVLGDNNGAHETYGNYAQNNGDNSGFDSTDGMAFITGSGNIIQIEILSDNVIAPQLAVAGNNDLDVFSSGNTAFDNGDGSPVTKTGTWNPLAGVFSITGSGNVIHIAILSNNVWAPQVALLGSSKGTIVTDVNNAGIPELDPVTGLPVVPGNGNGDNSPVTTDGTPPPPPRGFDVIRTIIGSGNADQWAKQSGNIWHDTFDFNVKVPVNTQVDPDVKVTPVVVPDPVEEQPTIVANAAPPGGGGNDGGPGNAGGDGGGPPVNPPTSKPHPVRDLIHDSVKALKDHKPAHKPGDGLKKVVKAVHDVLHPKPKPKPAASSDSPA